MRDAAFIHQKQIQASHKKEETKFHENLLTPQKYLVTKKLTNKQKSLLFILRCQSVRGITQNFSDMYFGDIKCRLCKLDRTSQSHILICKGLKTHFSWNQDIDQTGQAPLITDPPTTRFTTLPNCFNPSWPGGGQLCPPALGFFPQ